jgi:hypothetical protein
VPELPEVETVRAALAREIVGKKFKSVAVTNGRIVRRHSSAKEFRTLLEGRTAKSVSRLGKYLIVALDSGGPLVIHLGMSGQLLKAKGPKDPKPKHTHVVFTMSPASEIRYVDPRTFGELFVSTPLPEGEKADVSQVRPPVDRWRRSLAAPERARVGSLGHRSLRGPGRLGPLRGRTALENNGDQDGPHRPGHHLRHRQHLRRRDAVRGRRSLRPFGRVAVDDRNPPTAPSDHRSPHRGR